MPDEQQTPIDFVRSPVYRSIYANQTQFGSTAFDFSMLFGEIVEVAPDGSRLRVEQQAKVTMSPLHFKIFVATAAQNIRNYEARFGKIAIPAADEPTSTAIEEAISEPAKSAK